MFPTYFVGQVKSKKEMMQINSRIKQKHDTLANWTSNNIVLLDGELAVVDCGDQTRFKVGNGISAFTQLPFIDEHVLSTIWVTAHAISQGTQAHSTPFGFAAGWRLSANANYSQALGFKSQTSASHDFSFTWNGDDQSYSILGEDYYTSHGRGTFNINPLNGAHGFYIGEKSLQEIVDAIDPLNVPVQMVKPLDDQNLHISVDIFVDKEMQNSLLSNAGPIDSRLSSSFFSGFLPNGNESKWVECGAIGFSRQHNNLPIMFDMPAALSTLSIDCHIANRLYIKYSWYYLLSGNPVFSDPYSTTLPATTEVGANSQDTIGRRDFSNLYQNVIPQSQAIQLDVTEQYYLAHSTNYNIVPFEVTSTVSVALVDYDEHKTYKIDLSTGGTVNADIDFFVGLPNGNIEYSDELNAQTCHFKQGKHYLVEVKDEKVFVYDFSSPYAIQDAEAVAKAFQINMPIQMVKPTSDERMHLSIDLFIDKEMTDSILASPIDTETSSHFFYSFLPNGNDSHWIVCDASGFSRESNGLPVLFDMPEVFKELSIDFYSIDALYARYSWYYLSAGSRIFSDAYTTTLPGSTEVGANAQDVVSKSEFYRLYQNVVPQSQGVVVDDGDYFLTYSTKYNIITSRVEDGEKIALMEYDEHKTYKIDLSTSTSEDIELVFYIGLANGNIEWSEELNSEQHVFERNKHYFIEVRDQKIFVYDGDAVYAQQDSSSDVQVSAILDSGVQIASISVDGVATPIYAPTGGGGIYRYPLITAELSTIDGSLCCLIQDHTITTIEVSSAATPLVIKLPPKPADNGARDFILRIEVSSSTAPGVTFAGLDESITFDSDSEDWMAIEPGLNLISFTETR